MTTFHHHKTLGVILTDSDIQLKGFGCYMTHTEWIYVRRKNDDDDDDEHVNCHATIVQSKARLCAYFSTKQ
jgi:hypothetical protein